jgi:hypothetical protein
MQHHLLAFVLAGATAALAAAPAGAQNAPPSTAKPDKNKPVTMSGCVVKDMAANNQFMFIDNTDGSRYRLSGRDVSKFVGQPMQIVGAVDSRRLRIVGGLTPSPNVAGQAGSIDPGKAHVATLGGGTTGSGSGDLPTFKVAQVTASQGECPK